MKSYICRIQVARRYVQLDFSLRWTWDDGRTATEEEVKALAQQWLSGATANALKGTTVTTFIGAHLTDGSITEEV
jgi:hypothetical protein